jgi:hypothetical protein
MPIAEREYITGIKDFKKVSRITIYPSFVKKETFNQLFLYLHFPDPLEQRGHP